MSYFIKYEEIRSLLNQCSSQFIEWQEQLSDIGTKIGEFVSQPYFKGKAAEASTTYMQEVHGILLTAISQAISEFQGKLILYADGYYQIDDNRDAAIPEDTLDDILIKNTNLSSDFGYEVQDLSSALNSVNDIFSVYTPSSYAIINTHDTIGTNVTKLKDAVGEYENNTSTTHVSDLRELITSLTSLINEYSNKSTDSIPAYSSGDLASSANFEALYEQLQKSTQFTSANAEHIQVAAIHQGEINEAILAKQRVDDGWFNVVVSGLIIIGGITTIIITGGLATPIVVAGIAGGLGSIAYGASNMAEAANDIYLGKMGDPYTMAFNPIRDTVFSGNQQAYDIFGIISGMLCMVASPAAIGYKGATTAGTSLTRAIGVNYLKAGVTYGVGIGTNKVCEYYDLNRWATLGITGATTIATGYGVHSLDKALNLSGYHITILSKETLTKEILETKPKYSPNPEKWFNKGGRISIDRQGNWIYINSDGVAVRYVNGYPDFKGAGLVKQEVNIGQFTNRPADFKKANLLAPNGPISDGNTWHHEIDGQTLEEVNSAIHNQFSHIGGFGLSK